MTTDTVPATATRERYEINRGLLNGCTLYLSDQDRFSVRSGTFDKEIQSKFTEFANDARVFVDIGAAEGLYSVYMLKNTDAKVYSYETAAEASGDLLRNLEENTRNGHRLQFGDHRISGDPQDDAKTIDEIAGHERGPIFLKVEADGSEVEVLKGAGHILDREDTTLILRVSSKEAEQQCMWLLDEFNFDISIIGPAWWRSLVKDRASATQNRWIIASKAEIDGLFS